VLKIVHGFPTLNNFFAELDSNLNYDVPSHFAHNSQDLQITTRDYFPPKVEDFQWLLNPLALSFPKQELETKQSEDLIDTSTQACFQGTYNSVPLNNVWAADGRVSAHFKLSSEETPSMCVYISWLIRIYKICHNKD
jgi:hypothetical protein